MIYDNNECGSPEFLAALGVFDAVLDDLIHASRNGNGVAVSRSPASGRCSISTVKPVKTCACERKGGKSDRIGRLNILDDIDQIIFNDPATIVTFKDGSKVCVKACEKDPFNKETGLIYAIVKRLYANDIDDNGYLKSKGLGEKINKLIAGAVDQKEQERKRRAARKAKQEKKCNATDCKANMANEVSEQAAKEAVDQIHN